MLFLIMWTPATFLLKKKKKLFMHFIFGCAGSLLLCELSLFAASWGRSSVLVQRLLTALASLVQSRL